MKDKRIDTYVRDEEGRDYKLVKRVGYGAQGTVYEEASGEYIVKLLHRTTPTREEELVRRYSWLLSRKLTKEARLVQPISLLAAPNLGYVMRRVKGHEPLSKYIRPPAGAELSNWYNKQTGGLRKRLYISGRLASSFSSIHLQGLSYCDISPANILVGKKLLSVALIDPDNLSAAGRAESLMLGTPRYMAPEIVKRLSQPNPLSDIYAYAVLLFEMLCLGHPLLGDVVHVSEPEEEERALAGHYPYIDHPTDHSNHSSRILNLDDMLTPRLRKLFQTMFVEGLHNRLRRPALRDFYLACMEAAELTVECSDCSATYYFDKKHRDTTCPWCGHTQPMTGHLKMLRHISKPSEIEMELVREQIGVLVLRPGANTLLKRHFRMVPENDKLGVIEYNTSGELRFQNQSGGELYFVNGLTRKRHSIKDEEMVVLTATDLLFAGKLTMTDNYKGSHMTVYCQFVRGGE